MALALTMGWLQTAAQTASPPVVSDAEYFWDADPGFGQGRPIAITPGKNVNLQNLQIPATGLAAGEHILGVRARTSLGWGPTITQRVSVADASIHSGEQRVEAVEYFWDTDPGFGRGRPIAITPGKNVNLQNLQIPATGLAAGEHILGVRARTSLGWGPTITQRVSVADASIHSGEQRVEAVEYFWDTDPGFGRGRPIAITPGKNVNLQNLQIPATGLAAGEHILGVRARTSLGWGPTMTQRVSVADASLHDSSRLQITGIEYFWNEDPGYGHGTFVAVEPGQSVSLDDLQIPSAETHGDSKLFIRALGNQGWGPTVAYDIMVDAEGHYTLNAQAETSIETRNYQSLSEALADFADRGVGDDITLEVTTTGTDYALDATTEEQAECLQRITQQMSASNTPRHQKTVSFTAAEGSGNKLSVTTTAAALPTVVGFFAQTKLENVALTINGTAYDFSAAAERTAEVCSEEQTSRVNLSQISSKVKVSWQAQPHDGTTLTGFTSNGSGDLPAMTISNSGTSLDSLAYRVTLSDEQSMPLCEYTYYIYVHAKMANQQFTSLSPADGSSLDPVKTTLTWNAVGDALGYRLSISTDGGEAQQIELTAPEYELNVASGHHYAWTVTAIGFCDELTSQEQTFSGRLLPDLVVSSIETPEVAEAGNTIQVRATVKNQGEAATTEGKWIDRIYRVVNSTDFAQAEPAGELYHRGNLAAGESYEVTFTINVPMVDAGQLRVFVETDRAGNVLELDETNNRTMSTTAAELKPFYVDAADLAALRKLYSDFGGTQWNGTPWNVTSEIIKDGNWSGVTFNSDGQVTAINLQGRGLTGELSQTTAPQLPQLTSLNLSHNALEGDAAAFVTVTPSLKTLDLSYNCLCDLSGALPSTLTQVNVGCQSMDRSATFSELGAALPDNLSGVLPSIAMYDASKRTFGFDGYFDMTSNSDLWGQCSWRMKLINGSLQQEADRSVAYREDSGHEVSMRIYNGNTWNDMHLTIDYATGDANLDCRVNVADLQHTINYAVNDSHPRTFFNYQAADLKADRSINVLDVVRLVNLLLADEGTEARRHEGAKVQRYEDSSDAEADARIEWRDGELVLITERPVAALDLVVEHAANDVEWTLADAGWQVSESRSGNSSHVIVYSLTGRELPVGETVLARFGDGDVAVSRAMLVDGDAREVSVILTGTPTAILVPPHLSTSALPVYNTGGVRQDNDALRSGVYISRGKKHVVK